MHRPDRPCTHSAPIDFYATLPRLDRCCHTMSTAPWQPSDRLRYVMSVSWCCSQREGLVTCVNPYWLTTAAAFTRERQFECCQWFLWGAAGVERSPLWGQGSWQRL